MWLLYKYISENTTDITVLSGEGSDKESSRRLVDQLL